ncbi:MAG: SHOCT domain-containing protein [Acutalibacteraceae bacterium]|nr:SHOCT domain-containing protein [Acutalibacteraceae bacterium]
MDDKYYANETDFRFTECVFYHMAEDKIITFDEYEKLRDRLLDIYTPPVSELERGLSWNTRKSLK